MTKLTPDQLHRLIDEVADLVEQPFVLAVDISNACDRAECYGWWPAKGYKQYWRTSGGHAGLSAVLILLSEGG